MTAKIIISAPILYFLTLIQSSFMPHFVIFGYTINIIYFLIIFLIFFLPSFGFISAFAGGIFLDIFSTHFIGFSALILLAIVFFTRSVLKRYVQIPIK